MQIEETKAREKSKKSRPFTLYDPESLAEAKKLYMDKLKAEGERASNNVGFKTEA